MKKRKTNNSLLLNLKRNGSRLTLTLVALFVLGSSILPLFDGLVSAATLGSRSLTMSSGQSAGTGVTYTYGFSTQSAYAIQSIKFVACTNAVDTYSLGGGTGTGSCTGPNLQNINQGTQASASFTNAGGWTRTTSTTGNCAPANNVLCVTRTQATNEPAGAKSIGWNSQTNPTIPSGNGYSFYVGIYLYTDTGYSSSAADNGTVAGAVVSQLSITAQVAEILVFCVGTTSVDDATTAVGNASSCSGSTVDLGTLDPTSINYSKTHGNNLNGVAILRSNSSNGSAVYYDAVQDTTGTTHQGALRIIGANCTSVPGSCITSQGTSQGTFTAGTQKFGMTVAGTNCGTTTANSYYSCTYASSTEHLVPQSPYVGKTGGYCSPSNCNSDNGFAWDETGTAGLLAQASSGNVVADESLILKFAATPSITNTFGAYQVKADFTAVATY